MEYYNKSNNYFKVATYTYIKKGNYWYAKQVRMVNILKDHSTEILLTDVKFDQGISDDEFLVENLKQ